MPSEKKIAKRKSYLIKKEFKDYRRGLSLEDRIELLEDKLVDLGLLKEEDY